jgi:2-polyprenyl-3-methyl-5-hydroxy-6-metoxy-1,4-benzoquinol methylase
MDLENQPGFKQRAQMVTNLVNLVMGLSADESLRVTDVGCGDGALLKILAMSQRAWGYELGTGDVQHAQAQGLDVRQCDIITDELEYGDVVIASEVLEHLADPVRFLQRIPAGRTIIVSSPSRETGEWHNPIHTWAWDLTGYRNVIERGGWRPIYQTECSGGTNIFSGETRLQCFQAIVAVK